MRLNTTYLGLELEHPIVASAGPVAASFDGIRRLEDGGAAAIVLPSIYEEEVEAEDAAYEMLTSEGEESQPEALAYFPGIASHVGALEERLEHLRKSAEAVSVPIIASLNGSEPKGWAGVATDAEAAGASAIELNIYRVPAHLDESAAEVEGRWLDTVRHVRQAVKLPIAVKLGPWLTSPGHFAKALIDAGADGLVLFNRFYAPDIDLFTLKPEPSLELSRPYEIRQGLMWISLLKDHVNASLAATTGVDTDQEVIKYILAGADVVMSTSSVLRNGPAHLGVLRDGLARWLENRGFESLEAARGLLAANQLEDSEPLIRAQYMDVLQTAQKRYR